MFWLAVIFYSIKDTEKKNDLVKTQTVICVWVHNEIPFEIPEKQIFVCFN